MIRNLFLPEKIGNYVLFKKKIVSFSISKHMVNAVCILLHAQTKKVIQVFSEAVIQEGYETPELATSAVLNKILTQIGKYDELIVAVDSTYAIFKELSIPLLDDEKITQILGFELEHYLPFALQEAVFNFIIIQQDLTEKKSDVFAVAIQKERAQYYIDLFMQAGAHVDKLLIDVFDFFALYTYTNRITGTESAQFIITTDGSKTSVIYLENNILKKIRIIQDCPELHQNSAPDSWWSALSFTLESCIQNWPGETEIIFYGNFTPEILAKGKLFFNKTCTLVSISEILQNYNITDAVEQNQNQAFLTNIATGLDFSLTQNFNLLPVTSFTNVTVAAATKYITIVALTIALYGAFATHTFFEMKKYSTASELVVTKTLKSLKDALPALKATSVSEALRKAKTEIAKEEDIWFSFSSQTRHSFLTYLFDISTTIDRDTLGLDLKKMVFSKNGILLEGRVRSFDAVEELIKQLKNTNLFVQVPNLQKTEFSMLLPLANPTVNESERV